MTKTPFSRATFPTFMFALFLVSLTTGCLTAGCACGRGGGNADTAASPSEATSSETSASESESETPSAAVATENVLDSWWSSLEAICGQAFEGRLVSDDEADADLAGQSMVMHVRKCEENRLEIPFHIGENRSRTWVLTRDDDGVHLQHDHRHEDGTEDEVTLYGGRTDASQPGTKIAQFFPADDYSKELFTTHGLDVSVANTWSMEIVPGERFSYILRRPNRHFRADFDLGSAVDAPPAPWGHE